MWGSNQRFRWSPKVVCWQNSLFPRRGQSFVLVRLSADWMRPTKIMEGNLLYSKFTSLKVSLIQNTLTETLRITSNQLSGIVVQPSRQKINCYKKTSLSSFLKMWKLRIFKVKWFLQGHLVIKSYIQCTICSSCLIKSTIPRVTIFNFFHWSILENLCRSKRYWDTSWFSLYVLISIFWHQQGVLQFSSILTLLRVSKNIKSYGLSLTRLPPFKYWLQLSGVSKILTFLPGPLHSQGFPRPSQVLKFARTILRTQGSTTLMIAMLL